MNQQHGGPGSTYEIFRRPRIGSMPFFHGGFMNATLSSGARGRLFQAPIMFVQRSHSSGEHDLKIAGFPGELVRNL